MRTLSQFRSEVKSALEGVSRLKEVKLIIDDKKDSLNLREPSAGIVYKGSETIFDNGYPIEQIGFAVLIKLSNVAKEDNLDVLEEAYSALLRVNPIKISLKADKTTDRSTIYAINLAFNGVSS